MTGSVVAGPQCFVEVYPFEGGRYQMRGGAILACETEKSIHADSGRFAITLAPGGPFGTNINPSWAQVITPVSLVLIGMSRGIHRQITMIGVATVIAERTVFLPMGTVQHAIVVEGFDFSWFFNSFNWCSLSFLGGSAAAIGEATSGQASQGLPQVLSAGLLSGPPHMVAQSWYNQIMAGTSGILAQTALQYGQEKISFPAAMATLFEPYPGFTIPFGDYFIAAEGTWMQKFRSILPFPWYEFFVITAPQGAYGASGGGGFTMQGLGPQVIANPTLVARINPIPVLTASGGNQQISFTGIDTGRWQALTQYQPDFSYIESNPSFDANEVRNFYILDPTWMKLMFGQNNDTIIPYIFSFVGAYDPDSIHRYGYRPERAPIRWLSDLQGASAQQGADINSLVADLTARLISQYHPTPLMAKDTVRMELRPDILPGNRFTYQPFKGTSAGYLADTWDFYIEAVAHEYNFGHACSTTLKLTRGLPSAVYAEGGIAGLLTQVHLGTAQRVDGDYHAVSGKGLQAFSIEQANDVLANIAPVWNLPQQH